MRPLRLSLLSISAIGLLAALGLAGGRGQTPQADALKKANIIFTGTVTQVGAASLEDVPVSERTLVVRVDAVLEKPEAVSLASGDKVTVEAKESSLFREGGQATFYTEAWIFGEGLAVREVAHEVAPAISATEAAVLGRRQGEVSEVRKAITDAELRERVQAAQIVVVGRVKEVRAARLGLAAAGLPPSRVTEHDPAWQEAIIQVETAMKGATPNQEIVVRFPGSLDVAWHGVPKLKSGQEGTFILQKDQVTGTPKAALAGASVDTYTALGSKDILSKAEAERVRALLQP